MPPVRNSTLILLQSLSDDMKDIKSSTAALTVKVGEIREAQAMHVTQQSQASESIRVLTSEVSTLRDHAAEQRGARRLIVMVASVLGVVGGALADFFAGAWRGHVVH